MNAKDEQQKSDEEERRKQVTVFQHPDVPFLKISINSSGRVSQSSSGTENERERGGERTSCRTSLRRPTPTAPKSGGLSVPREVKARSLSPARERPGLPSGRQAGREEADAGIKPKRSFIDTGSAKLFEKAADLKSSLDSPHYRVPSMRDEYQESVSLPSSPINSRKIGLSYMTPPTTRKFGSSVSPIIPSKHDEANSKPPKLAQNLIRTEARSSAPVQPIPTPFTFHLRACPDQPSSSPSSRSSSPAPFTSMLKSPTPVAESSVSQRVSRFDTASRSDQLTPGSGTESDVKKRGVSPTPLGNLRLASSRPHGETAGGSIKPVPDEVNGHTAADKAHKNRNEGRGSSNEVIKAKMPLGIGSSTEKQKKKPDGFDFKEFLEKCKTEFEEKWNHPKHVSLIFFSLCFSSRLLRKGKESI